MGFSKTDTKAPKVHIELDNQYRSYFAGQVVSGQVVINNAKPKDVKEVTISLEGKGHVHWTEHHHYTVHTIQIVNGQSRSMPVTHTTILTFSAKEDYVAYKSSLVGDGVTLITLPEGRLTYPFQFILPTNLPSSFSSSYGQVSYSLEAEIRRQLLKPNNRTRLPFTVNGIFDLNLEPATGIPMETRKVKGSNFFACRKGQLGFVLSVPRCGFVPGEVLDFRAEISNGSNRKITGITISLQQVTTFYAQGRTKYEEKLIMEVKGPEVDKGEHEMWSPGNSLIPAVPPTRLGGNCRIIDVNYYLLFEMKIGGLSSSLTDKIPIMIGNIPLRETFSHFIRMPQQQQQQQPSLPSPTPGYPPGMGFRLPKPPAGPSALNSFCQPGLSEKSGNLDEMGAAPVPSAPLFADYPDLPPPSYAEAVASDGFTWNPEVGNVEGAQNGDSSTVASNGGSVSTNQPASPPIEPPVIDKDFVPNYITYNRI